MFGEAFVIMCKDLVYWNPEHSYVIDNYNMANIICIWKVSEAQPLQYTVQYTNAVWTSDSVN